MSFCVYWGRNVLYWILNNPSSKKGCEYGFVLFPEVNSLGSGAYLIPGSEFFFITDYNFSTPNPR